MIASLFAATVLAASLGSPVKQFRLLEKTEGQDVGLFHSLQHAGLSRRALANAPTVHVDLQASDYATNLGP
jgi:hypothetical protein